MLSSLTFKQDELETQLIVLLSIVTGLIGPMHGIFEINIYFRLGWMDEHGVKFRPGK